MTQRNGRSEICFRLLGTVAVGAAPRCVPFRRPLEQSLLAILLLEANRTVLIDDLINRLWGEHLPGTPRETLSSHGMLPRPCTNPEPNLDFS